MHGTDLSHEPTGMRYVAANVFDGGRPPPCTPRACNCTSRRSKEATLWLVAEHPLGDVHDACARRPNRLVNGIPLI